MEYIVMVIFSNGAIRFLASRTGLQLSEEYPDAIKFNRRRDAVNFAELVHNDWSRGTSIKTFMVKNYGFDNQLNIQIGGIV